jgi:hypothetical protein
MTFRFSSAQISGLQVFEGGFRLNNPLALQVARLDDSGDSRVDLYLKDLRPGGQEIRILAAADRAASLALNAQRVFSASAWLESEGRAIHGTAVLDARRLAANSFPYWRTGEYALFARASDGTEHQAIQYSANANVLEAVFADGLRVSVGSLNTIIKIPEYALTEKGSYAQDIRYSRTNYERAIESIDRFHDQLPIESVRPLPIPIQRSDGKVVVQYQFTAGDPMFGVGGLHPLLGVVAGRDPVPLSRSEYGPIGAWASAEQIKDRGGDTGAYPWYSAVGPDGPTLIQYLASRRDQYEPELAFGTNNNLDPYLRAPDFVGVSGDEFGGFRYIATLAVDPSTIFRPKGGVAGDPAQQAQGQSWLNSAAGPLPDVFRLGSSGGFEVDPQAEAVGWLPGLDTRGLKVWDEASESWKSWPTFGAWYRDWWENNVTAGGFPFTGLGYTYDPYYPTKAGWDAGPPRGPATSEFVQLWRPEGVAEERWNYDILDVQTIAQALGAQTPDPNRSEPLQLEIRSLGRYQADLFFYEADSITGLIVEQRDANSGLPTKTVAVTDAGYLETAVARSQTAGTFLLHEDLPSYGTQRLYGEAFGLISGTNYGVVVRVETPEGERFYGSYGDGAGQFLTFADPEHNGFALGFEDQKVGTGDDDFNDLLLIFSVAASQGF